jgi:hypothetical protein
MGNFDGRTAMRYSLILSLIRIVSSSKLSDKNITIIP